MQKGKVKGFVLASASPRRKELLSRFIPSFEVIPPEIDEAFAPGGDIDSELQRIACEKASAVAALHPDKVVIAADTIVISGNTPLGKPSDEAHARLMLQQLNGKKHYVKTAVHTIIPGGEDFHFISSTEVLFYDYSDELIDWYITTGEPFDKAGAYGIQGYGALLVRSVNGDYNNIVGLPVAELIQKLISYGALSIQS